MGGINDQSGRMTTRRFNPEGSGYDYSTAKFYGMGRDGTGENKGHYGSVAPASEYAINKYNLPKESYVILKGKAHETYYKAVRAERLRGFQVKKFGNRYYSIPRKNKGNLF